MPIIIGGDLNLTLDHNKDNFNYQKENNKRARQAVNDLMSRNDLVDIYTVRNPDGKRFTWRVGNPVLKQARSDMFLISNVLEGYVVSHEVQPGHRADHSMVVMQLDVAKQERGRGLFKFNASLLKDKDYIKLVKEKIALAVREYSLAVYRLEYVEKNPNLVQFTIEPSLFFETLIMIIRRETVSFGIKKKRVEREKEKGILDRIGELQKKLDDSEKEEVMENLQQLEAELEKLREHKLNGSIVRSRARGATRGGVEGVS